MFHFVIFLNLTECATPGEVSPVLLIPNETVKLILNQNNRMNELTLYFSCEQNADGSN